MDHHIRSPWCLNKDKSYKELFGERSSQLLSIYEHDHDHVHTADGNIEKNEN